MVEELIPIFGILLGIGGPAVVIIVWFWLNYHKRRKLMELHHTERMAAIERGMEIPPLPIELINGRSVPKRRRTALLPGLVWFFIGLAFVIGVLSGDADGEMPMFVGWCRSASASRISSITSSKGARSKHAGWSTISPNAATAAPRPRSELHRPACGSKRPAVQLCAAGRVFGDSKTTRGADPGMLSIRNLSKSYGDVQALRDVSLEVPRGMFGLLGPNGAGKSSLMRTIATLQDPDSGSIHLRRYRRRRRKGALRAHARLSAAGFRRLSESQRARHARPLRGAERLRDREERARNGRGLLRPANLWDVRKRKLGTFSGGMRQRFGIAQALLGSPSWSSSMSRPPASIRKSATAS